MYMYQPYNAIPAHTLQDVAPCMTASNTDLLLHAVVTRHGFAWSNHVQAEGILGMLHS